MHILQIPLSFAFAAAATLLAPVHAPLGAATTTPVVSGLRAPTKLVLSKQGNLLVTEAGLGPNTGRISIVDPATGARRTLLDGLPSSFAWPNQDPSGPSALLLCGRTLYVTIGTGDAVVSGAPGTSVPNPQPTSPIFSSLLAIHFSANVEKHTNGFTLSAADQAAIKAGARVVLDHGAGDRLTVELVADFDDHVPEPVAAEPNAVRASNPFGIARIGDELFVADASMNIVRTVDLDSGNVATLTAFAPVPNTRGFGPPVCEAVPDSIHAYGDQVFVTLLTGFPFPIGAAQVRLVDPETGTGGTVISGLTSAIDVLPVECGGLYTLEFSADMLVPLPGRLRWFAAPNASPIVISDTLITPTCLARDEKTGTIYVTQIFAGNIVKLSSEFGCRRR